MSLARTILAGALLITAGQVAAQVYPSRAVKMIILDRLHSEITKILRAPNTLDRLAGDGSVAVASTPEEFAVFIKSEHAKWSKVVREANIRVE